MFEMSDLEVVNFCIARLKTKGFKSQKEIGKALGYSNESSFSQVITGRVPLPNDLIDRIQKLDPNIKNFINSIEIIKPEGEIKTIIKQNVKKTTALIPFYNADFIAGNAEIYYEDATIYPEYYLDVPEFSGCTAFRAFSDSMEKSIRSGSTLFGTKLEEWKSHLEFGQIYGITCCDGRRYLKYIRANKEDRTRFLLRSENDNYDDFTLPKDKIKNIWLINGWINKNT